MSEKETYRGKTTEEIVHRFVEHFANYLDEQCYKDAFCDAGYSAAIIDMMESTFPAHVFEQESSREELIMRFQAICDVFKKGERHCAEPEILKAFVVDGVKKDGEAFFETAKNIVGYNEYVFDFIANKNDLLQDQSIFAARGCYETVKDMVRQAELLPVDQKFICEKAKFAGKILDISVCPTKESQQVPTEEDYTVFLNDNRGKNSIALPKESQIYKEMLEEAKNDAFISQTAAAFYSKVAEAGKEYETFSQQKINSYASYCAEEIVNRGFTRVNLDKTSPFTPHLKRALEERAVYVLVGEERYVPHYKDGMVSSIAIVILDTREGSEAKAKDRIEQSMLINRMVSDYTPETMSKAYQITNEALQKYGVEMPISLQIEEADRLISIARDKKDVTEMRKLAKLKNGLQKRENQIRKERGEANKATNRLSDAR